MDRVAPVFVRNQPPPLCRESRGLNDVGAGRCWVVAATSVFWSFPLRGTRGSEKEIKTTQQRLMYIGAAGSSKPSALPQTLSSALNMTVATVIAGQVMHKNKRNRRGTVERSESQRVQAPQPPRSGAAVPHVSEKVRVKLRPFALAIAFAKMSFLVRDSVRGPGR